MNLADLPLPAAEATPPRLDAARLSLAPLPAPELPSYLRARGLPRPRQPWQIELRGAGKTYGEEQAPARALRGVDLRIAAGEFIAVMGPPGAGKSTALNLLGCLDLPSEGSCLFRGVRTDSLAPNSRSLLRRACIGFVSPAFNPLLRVSAREYVGQPLVYAGQGEAARGVEVEAVLEAVGLAGWEERRLAQLSIVQQRRLAIARALVTRPLVLLIDEARGGMDASQAGEIADLLAELNQARGITVLMVTRQPEAAARAHRVLRFADGRLQSDTLAVAQEAGCLP